MLKPQNVQQIWETFVYPAKYRETRYLRFSASGRFHDNGFQKHTNKTIVYIHYDLPPLKYKSQVLTASFYRDQFHCGAEICYTIPICLKGVVTGSKWQKKKLWNSSRGSVYIHLPRNEEHEGDNFLGIFIRETVLKWSIRVFQWFWRTSLNKFHDRVSLFESESIIPREFQAIFRFSFFCEFIIIFRN